MSPNLLFHYARTVTILSIFFLILYIIVTGVTGWYFLNPLINDKDSFSHALVQSETFRMQVGEDQHPKFKALSEEQFLAEKDIYFDIATTETQENMKKNLMRSSIYTILWLAVAFMHLRLWRYAKHFRI